MHYQHTQKIPDKVLLAAGLGSLLLGLTPPGFLARLALVGVLGAVTYNFRSLTVEVDEYEVRLCFGDGPIKKSFAIADLSTVKSTRTKPINGWGIHWTGEGWLYNIYGLDAVELSFNDGSKVLIGTDEPDELLNALNNRLIIVHE